jgi:hypothetical protein
VLAVTFNSNDIIWNTPLQALIGFSCSHPIIAGYPFPARCQTSLCKIKYLRHTQAKLRGDQGYVQFASRAVPPLLRSFARAFLRGAVFSAAELREGFAAEGFAAVLKPNSTSILIAAARVLIPSRLA